MNAPFASAKPLAIVPGLLAALACAAAAQDALRVGQEILLPADQTAGNYRGEPAVAFGKDVYLVVWREGWHGKGGAARVVAARADADGRLIDAKPIQLAPDAKGVQERPRVAFAEGVFLVVWQAFNGRDCDVQAARLSPEGKLLDAAPIEVAGGPRTQAAPDVAAGRDRFVVVWQGLSGEETAYRGFAATVGPDGKVGPPVETRATPQPRIAFNDQAGKFLLVSGGIGVFGGSVAGVLLGPDAKPLPGQTRHSPILYGTKAADFSISSAPGGWLVVSHRAPPDPWGWGGPGAMRAALVDADAKVLNADALKEPSGAKGKLPGWLDVGREKKEGSTWPWGASASVFDGRHSVVIWQRHHLTGEKMTAFTNCDLIAARVEGFQSLDSEGIPLAAGPTEETHPALAAAAPGRLLCIYQKTDPAKGSHHVAARTLQTR